MKVSSGALCYVLTALATPIFSFSLLEILRTTPSLSTLYGYINASSSTTALLANANNFTFLAPDNDALTNFVSPIAGVATPDALLLMIQYSLLQGVHTTLSITSTPHFISTALNNATVSRVTGGQSIELIQSSTGVPQFVSGNKTISLSPSSELLCTGGIIHILTDNAVSLPISTVAQITSTNLVYTPSILAAGNYLSSNATYILDILAETDVTYFLPNSASALSAITALAANSTAAELMSVFEYHIVEGSVLYSTGLTDGLTLKSVQGDDLSITVEDGDIYVNDAMITEPNFIVTNGVVHIIDALLNRFDTAGPPPVTSTGSSSTDPSSTASAAAISSSTNTTEDTSGISKGGIIGIAVGASIAVIIFVGLLAIILLRQRRRRNQEQEQETAKTRTSTWSTSPLVNRSAHNSGITVRKDIVVDGARKSRVAPIRVDSRGYLVRGPSHVVHGGSAERGRERGSGDGVRSMHVEDHEVRSGTLEVPPGSPARTKSSDVIDTSRDIRSHLSKVSPID